MTAIPAGSTRPAHAGDPCPRCGASGTHYLTCPSLRLPPRYRAQDRAAPRPGAGRITGGRPGRLCGGPDHPDWPLPPRR